MLVPAIHFPNTCAEAHKLYQEAFNMTINHVTYNDEFPEEHGEPLTDEARKLICIPNVLFWSMYQHE